MQPKLTVRDLKVGDKFYPKSKDGKATPIFQIRGPVEFSPHGRAVRRCADLTKNEFVNKTASLEVIKAK